ncbi:hypothetical protein TNCV_2310521 [Trichonephila clavipes]|nr:hypothetical protein TNCV_2310521 [Trichonephila clavipes]
MASLSHQSLTPTELGRVDEDMASPGGRLSQHVDLRSRNHLCKEARYAEISVIDSSHVALKDNENSKINL